MSKHSQVTYALPKMNQHRNLRLQPPPLRRWLGWVPGGSKSLTTEPEDMVGALGIFKLPCERSTCAIPYAFVRHTLRTWVFQLTQLAQWEGRRWNGKVERSAETVLFNTGFTTSANGSGGQQLQCSGKPVCGESIMWNHHESNQKIGQRVQKLKQVHQVDQTWLPRCKVALLGAVPCICCAPLPV